MNNGRVFWIEIPRHVASMINIEEGITLQMKPEGPGKFTAKLNT